MTENWDAFKIATDGVPMVDSGTGKALVLRTFEFKFNPLKLKEYAKKGVYPTKQGLFNAHWPQIRTIIWGDGFVANTDVAPRVIIGKTQYRIFLLCEPKFRVIIGETPKTLQQVFKKTVQKKK